MINPWSFYDILLNILESHVVVDLAKNHGEDWHFRVLLMTNRTQAHSQNYWQ